MNRRPYGVAALIAVLAGCQESTTIPPEFENDAEAVRWFRLAVEQGQADAQFNLGRMYTEGWGVIKDEAEAVRWYRLAAKQGHADAQFWLGYKYADGKGVLKDNAEAVRWYRLAAKQGHADAQFWLGYKSTYGEGVLQDEAEAVRWYRLAAEQGQAYALFRLGRMYDKRAGRYQGRGRSGALVPAGRRAGPPPCAVHPRGQVRHRARRPQGFRACAHVVQHRWRKRVRRCQEASVLS